MRFAKQVIEVAAMFWALERLGPVGQLAPEFSVCYRDAVATLRATLMAKTPALSVQQRFGARMHALRCERELTQEAVATRIGISQKYLSELERGEKSPSWETLVAIAHQGFDIELATLMFGIDVDLGSEVKDLSDVLAGRPKEVRDDVLRAIGLILSATESSK